MERVNAGGAGCAAERTFVGRGHWPDQQPRRLRALVSIPTIDKLGTTHAARPSIRISPSNSQHARTAISLNVRVAARCVVSLRHFRPATCRLPFTRRKTARCAAARCRAGPRATAIHPVCTPVRPLKKSVHTLQPYVQPVVQPAAQPAGRNVLNIHIINKENRIE